MVYFLARPMKISHLGPTLNFEAFYSKNDSDFVDVSTQPSGQASHGVSHGRVIGGSVLRYGALNADVRAELKAPALQLTGSAVRPQQGEILLDIALLIAAIAAGGKPNSPRSAGP